MSDRIRGLLVAGAFTVSLAAGLWVLGVGGASHALATADADRAIMHRVVAGAVTTTLRMPAAALAAGSLPLTIAALVPTRAETRAGTLHGRSRLYALFHVYQL